MVVRPELACMVGEVKYTTERFTAVVLRLDDGGRLCIMQIYAPHHRRSIEEKITFMMN